jgi:predicted RNA-binding Zn-ribbon protein involved in translation (DUF1610 family)
MKYHRFSMGTAADPALVTVARFAYPGDAAVARTALEAAGIDAVISDDISFRLDWLSSRGWGGTKIRIRADDWDRAEEILSTIPEADLGTEPGVAVEEPHSLFECPRCGAPGPLRVPKLRIFGLAALILVSIGFLSSTDISATLFMSGLAVALVLLIVDDLRCQECGMWWR